MLLSSALPCDRRACSSITQQPQQLLSPALVSDDEASTPRPTTTLYSTCRALQSMLMIPSTPPPSISSPRPHHLSSPISFARTPPSSTRPPRVKVRKIAPRGLNKRRRPIEDDGRAGSPISSSSSSQPHPEKEHGHDDPSMRFSTPKRQRIAAPPDLPRGLALSDFDALDRLPESHPSTVPGDDKPNHRTDTHAATTDGCADDWTSDDDRALVQLVLEKLKLSTGDWVDCAKSLGKDEGSVGRRWESLMGEGSVGIRAGSAAAAAAAGGVVGGSLGRRSNVYHTRIRSRRGATGRARARTTGLFDINTKGVL
ncbi:MAG: hypothetical protein M1837_005650 [Sclerophora amabilis]|nr:MAG: hypothetical protein M1837_005650 [Sclerophora amabilis]